MESVLPVLPIDEYEAAVDFYTRLGFEVLMEHRHEPGFPVFMIVGRNDLRLGLSEHSRGHQGSEVYLYIDDIKAWHERCVDRGVPLEHPPTAMPWGNTEMLLIDPFGNALRFSQTGTHEGQSTPNK